METAVRKATRLDYNPPKEKHLSTLTRLTYESPGNAATIVDLIKDRLRENSWIIIFKSLITIHTLMRLGDGEKIISYVETQPSALDTSKLREKSSGVVHIQNIYLYTAYLEQKVNAYRQLRYDYVKSTVGNKESKLRRLSVQDGLLKETVILQKQISALLKCNFILDDVDNNISLYAFRLLIEDLLVLFQVMNESIVNILEHYFTMDKPSARTSLEIYKRFAKQTQDTISLLEKARRMQHELHISIPTVSHAPLSLAAALQEYLEENHSAEQTTKSAASPPQTNNLFQPSAVQHSQPKELIDFFASLEKETVNIFYNPVIQQQQIQQQQIQQQQQQIQLRQQQQSIANYNPFRTEPQPLTIYNQNNDNNANPFRASTMPSLSNSSPLPFSNTSQTMTFTPQQAPRQQLAVNNPFILTQNNTIVASPTGIPSSHNPFTIHPVKPSWNNTMP